MERNPALGNFDPIWLSLGPLIAFNVILLGTLFYFSLTYHRQKRVEDVDQKEHTRLLSRFLKEYWYWLSTPIERILISFKVRPNSLTTAGLVLCCVAAWFFHTGHIGLGGWFMIFGSTFDMFDGRVARLTGQVSPSGAFFDSIVDRFSEAVVFLGLASLYRDSWVLYPTIVALIGSMMVSYTRARGEGLGIRCTTGMMQRPERIVYLGVGSIFSPIFAYPISFIFHVPYDFMTVGAIIIIALLTHISAIQRARFIARECDKKP